MFSKRFFRLYLYLIQINHYAGATPLKIEKHTLKLSVDSKAIPRVRINFYLNVLWIFLSFVIIHIRIKAKEDDQLYISLAFLLALILMSVTVSILTFHSQNCCRAISGVLSLVIKIHSEFFRSNFNPEKSKYNLVAEALLFLLAMNYFCLGVVVSLLVAYDPRGVLFFGRLIPEEYFFAPVKLLVMLVHVYIICVNLMACCTLVCGGLIYGFYITLLYSKELRIRNSCNTYLTTDALRQSTNLRLIFRSFQLVHRNMICFIGLYIVLGNVFIIMSVAFMNFVLLRYWTKLHTIIKVFGLGYSVMFVLIWSAILQLGKLLFVKGIKVLNSWKGKNWGSGIENKTMNRFRASCKPLLLSYGTQFVIGKQSILVFYRCVTRGTVRALLTL